MRSPPERMPDVDRRLITRVPPDLYLRFDTCDDSLDPRLVGRRVELRVSQRELLASRSRRASSPASTGAHSLATARLLRSSTPARCGTLKAPAAARALPKLAERDRREEWSYECFAETLLATEVASRDAHGGESRIKPARFPARKTLEEFDFSVPLSVQTLVLHLGQLAFLTAKDNVLLGPPGTGKTHRAIALGIRACLAGQRVASATATEWVTRLSDAQRQGRASTRSCASCSGHHY